MRSRMRVEVLVTLVCYFAILLFVSLAHASDPNVTRSGSVAPPCGVRYPTGRKSVAQPSAVINEIMANEPGSETALEWVELFNRSETTIDLGDYLIIDEPDTSYLDAVVLPPGEHAVLARDTSAFELHWGDSTGTWGDGSHEDYLLIEIPMRLRNSGDTVAVHGPDGEMTGVFWEQSPADGISLERVRYDVPADQAEFRESIDPSGATPGRINSQTPRENDLKFDSVHTHFVAAETLQVTVMNAGIGASSANTLYVYMDENENTIGELTELIHTVPVTTLAEGMSDTLLIDLSQATVNHVTAIVLQLADDGNLFNNSLSLSYRPPGVSPEIVINEFMPDPEPDGSREWIELLVTSLDGINLAGWSIGDSVSQSGITENNTSLVEGQYLVLCEDRIACFESYPETMGDPILEVSPWRSLNNGGDKIILRDAGGGVVDSLTYMESFGGGRSWERISPSISAADPENWMGSVDPHGATPGRKNSVSVQFIAQVEIDLSPNPFRAGEEAVISYHVPRETELSIRLFSRNGRQVATILDAQPVVSGSLRWDGRGNFGHQLPPGLYVMLIETNNGSATKLVVAIAP